MIALKIPFLSRRAFFSDLEKNQIVGSIREAEKQTSGEIRVYVESRCRFVDPLDRATEVFEILEMHKTTGHNAVLIYVAVKDKQMAIYGDQGIHEKVGEVFWQKAIMHILSQFQREHFSDAISKVILDIGDALKYHYPYDGQTDVNELPDDIVFGR